MANFVDYKKDQAKWITVIESEFFPDYLEKADLLYAGVIEHFKRLARSADSSQDLLREIVKVKDKQATQLMRVFRKFVSPDTSVEMLKRKSKVEEIIRDFGDAFRPIGEVMENLDSRPDKDEALMALLYEYKDRGKKGYELTKTFFAWFNARYGEDYLLAGPEAAGPDIQLKKALPGFEGKVPADFVVSRKDGTPLVVGFARYDSDRGGAQEDDRTGGNRDKITEIRKYAQERRVALNLLFLNDGPGLCLGSMWDDYCALEDYGEGDVMVCTLKMLDERFTQAWFDPRRV